MRRLNRPENPDFAEGVGAFVAKRANRPDLVLWQGTCVVHETFSERRLIELMAQHPDAEVIAHPDVGAISCLNYARKVVQMPIAVAAQAVAQASMPFFAENLFRGILAI